MAVAPQTAHPTAAEYKAAEARLRQVRDEAAAGVAASQAKGDVAAGNEWASKLQKQFEEFKVFRQGIPRDVLLSIHADRILESFSIEEDRSLTARMMSIFGKEPMQSVCLVIPQDISDKDAMHALDARFRELFPDKRRDQLGESSIDWILNSGDGSDRRTRGSRVVKVVSVVPGTTAMTREQQSDALRKKGLTFPHPIEQALAAAAYACKHDGDDLFKGMVVRGSAPGIALVAYYCINVIKTADGDQGSLVAASGTPAALVRNPR